MNLINPYISFLAPVTIYPGELEMEALAYGAYTINKDRTLLKTYRAEEPMSKNYDTVVIGGGTGGYVTAIKLSQLGQQVTVVEKK